MTNQTPPPKLSLNWAVAPDPRQHNFLSTLRVPRYRVGDGVLYSPNDQSPAAYTVEAVLSPSLTTATNTHIGHRYQLRRRTPFPRRLDSLIPATIVLENHIVRPCFRVGHAVRMWVSGGGQERGMHFQGRVVGFWCMGGEYVYEVELEGLVRVWEGELMAGRAVGDAGEARGRPRWRGRGRGRSGKASWVRQDWGGRQVTSLDSMLSKFGFERPDFDDDDSFFYDGDDYVGDVELTALSGSLG